MRNSNQVPQDPQSSGVIDISANTAGPVVPAVPPQDHYTDSNPGQQQRTASMQLPDDELAPEAIADERPSQVDGPKLAGRAAGAVLGAAVGMLAAPGPLGAMAGMQSRCHEALYRYVL